MRWCGPEVEVEGIVSVKTGGCPEDCHFCSQSGLFSSPVRVGLARHPVAGAGGRRDRGDRRDRVLHRRRRARAGRAADGADARGRRGDPGGGRHQRRRLARACSPRSRSTSSPTWACTATTTTSRPRARYFPQRRDHAHLGGALGDPDDGPRRRHGGLLRRHRRHGRDARAARRVRRAARRARARRGAAQLPQPAARHAVRRPAGDVRPEALRTIAAFRLALPRTILRYAGGREITLGDLGTRDGMLGGINAVIVGNYLTTLGRPGRRPGPARRAEDAGQGALPTRSDDARRDALTSRRVLWAFVPAPAQRDNLRRSIPARRSPADGQFTSPTTPRETRLLVDPTARARAPSATTASPWNWLLLVPLVVALFPPIYNSIDPDAARLAVLLLVPDGRDRRSASLVTLVVYHEDEGLTCSTTSTASS